MSISERTILIKRWAAELGFAACGISRAEFLDAEAPVLERWLQQGLNADMEYMANHTEKRLDPRQLMPGAKSVLTLMVNYYPPETQPETAPYKISKYAYGRDYHRVIKKKLKKLTQLIRAGIGDVKTRSCVDSAPILEKAWAVRAGLGWIGKNSVLFTPRAGSFHFLAELLLDIELEYDQPMADHCGTCRQCIDACPTEAIVEPYLIKTSKCISYHTIENIESIPAEMKGKYKSWIFGCDICQDICPFNRFSKPHQEPRFIPHPGIFKMTRDEWRNLSEERFDELFRGSAVKRIKYEGLMRNIRFLE
jgi:epoxyqueuosine reductase